MKNRFKDFLAGVGSVLDINPDVKIRIKSENLSMSDLDKIGEDFKVIGDDIRNTIEAISVKDDFGHYQLKLKILDKAKEDYDNINKAIRIARIINSHNLFLHTSADDKRLSVGPDGRIDWNDHESEELKTR